MHFHRNNDVVRALTRPIGKADVPIEAYLIYIDVYFRYINNTHFCHAIYYDLT